MRGGYRTRQAAALFGGIALAVQALLPLLLAVEIRLATTAEFPAAHAAAATSVIHPHQPSPFAPHHHGIAGSCPLCLALAANHGFTATTPAAPPLPNSAALDLIAVAPPERPVFRALSSYFARAPPPMG